MRADAPPELMEALTALAPVSLGALDASAALRTRLDRKYVVSWDAAGQLVANLGASHRVLEIDGSRAFAYRSNYLDSADLGAFRAHMQGRRRRFKCRTRHYVDTDQYVFEVKLKGLRGATVKHQVPIARAGFDEPDHAAFAFAAPLVGRDEQRLRESLAPTLRTEYTRVTLAHGEERVTLDFGLAFETPDGRHAAMTPGYAVVESKSATGAGRADIALRRMGVRPLECSKYCVGVALTREDVRANSLQWLLRRHFAQSDTLTEARAHG